jgi:hypothetical protein
MNSHTDVTGDHIEISESVTANAVLARLSKKYPIPKGDKP